MNTIDLEHNHRIFIPIPIRCIYQLINLIYKINNDVCKIDNNTFYIIL